MQAIEVVVFLLFAVMVAGMIMIFVFNINFESIYQNVSSILMPKPNTQYFEEVNIFGLIRRMNDCWKQCSFGDLNMSCGAVYLNTKDLNSEQALNGLWEWEFNWLFKKYNYCTDCDINVMHERENRNVVPPVLDPVAIKPPQVLQIDCNYLGNKALTVR